MSKTAKQRDVRTIIETVNKYQELAEGLEAGAHCTMEGQKNYYGETESEAREGEMFWQSVEELEAQKGCGKSKVRRRRW